MMNRRKPSRIEHTTQWILIWAAWILTYGALTLFVTIYPNG